MRSQKNISTSNLKIIKAMLKISHMTRFSSKKFILVENDKRQNLSELEVTFSYALTDKEKTVNALKLLS